MFPGPRFALLVLSESREAGDQQTTLAAGTQPYIHLVQPAGSRVHGKQMHHALGQTQEEHLVVDALAAIRRRFSLLALPRGVVQEDDIQIGTVAELATAELAVSDDADRDRATLCTVAAHRHAPLRTDLAQ